MVWQPTSTGGVAPESQESRCGTMRQTMKTNPLLAKADLGKIKPVQFNNPSQDHVFGYSLPHDPEGAREVTMIWKEHMPSPGREARTDGKPAPDFKTMNKMAVKSGLTTAKELPAFRQQNMVTVKKFDHTRKPGPVLPSDKNARHTYGLASSHRPAEMVRQCGPEEPPVKHLVQGAYQDDWIRNNQAKSEANVSTYIPPVPTRATIGHAIGAQRYLHGDYNGEEWKMTKFKKVGPKVTQYMGATRSFNNTQMDAEQHEASGYEHEEAAQE